MILVAHRGNLNGYNPYEENKPDYIDSAIGEGYDVEIDIRYIDGKLYLGHDNPDYEISFEWLLSRKRSLWIHCKNLEAVCFFDEMRQDHIDLNYFWHQKDDVTLTSQNYIWAYPGKQPVQRSIAVLPEIFNEDTTRCIGICSDTIRLYSK